MKVASPLTQSIQFIKRRQYVCPRCRATTRVLSHLSNRTFHTSRVLRVTGDDTDYYATLELSPSASQIDIKKQFYQLSKKYHPDRNLKNQEAASKKFMAISQAYQVIGHPEKRQKYDRERRPASAPSFSGSQYSPGGRRSSGLSKRRTAFHGPPPSFYASGGWGQSAEKRRSNVNTGASNANTGQAGADSAGASGPYGGQGASWPFQTDPNDVPHFNREGHYKTTSTLEEQLRKGRRKRRRIFDTEIEELGFSNAAGRFFGVTAILFVAVGLPFMILRAGGMP